MRTLNWTLNAAALAALTFAAGGCTLDIEHRDRYDDRPVVVERPVERPVVVERRYHYGYHPDHIVVVEQPPANQVVVATEAPPPVYTEAIPANTFGPDYIWVGGNWVISGGNWVWVRGHYDRRPHRDAVWVGGSWDHHGDRFEFHEGHWR